MANTRHFGKITGFRVSMIFYCLYILCISSTIIAKVGGTNTTINQLQQRRMKLLQWTKYTLCIYHLTFRQFPLLQRIWQIVHIQCMCYQSVQQTYSGAPSILRSTETVYYSGEFLWHHQRVDQHAIARLVQLLVQKRQSQIHKIWHMAANVTPNY